jgi:hypothetical protein
LLTPLISLAGSTNGRAEPVYPDVEVPLKEPVRDARALGTELQRRSFDVVMQQLLDQFYGKIKSGATAVIFLADLQFNPTGKPT